MLRFLLWHLTRRLPCRCIDRVDGVPYLERYYLGQLGGRVFYLHRFRCSDPDGVPHNHPFPLPVSTILLGSYREIVGTATRLTGYADQPIGHGDLLNVHCTAKSHDRATNHVIPATAFHRVILPPGVTEVWTLFSHGWWDRAWGFADLAVDLLPPATVGTAKDDLTKLDGTPEGTDGYHYLARFRLYAGPEDMAGKEDWWSNAPDGATVERQRRVGSYVAPR